MNTTAVAASEAPLVTLSKRKIYWYMTILYLLFASDLWARVGINALLPLIQADLGLTDTQVGILGSSVLVGMIVFVLPASYMADKWSKRGTVWLMGLTWSIGTILCGFAPGVGLLVVGRFLVGGGNSSYAPASVSMFTDWFPRKQWGKVIGLYNTSFQIGISGGLMATGILAARYGWKTTFMIIGGASLMLSMLALCIPEPRKSEAQAPRVSVKEALRVVLRCRTLMLVALGTTFFNMKAMAVMIFTPIFFMREMGMDVSASASLLGLMGLSGFIGMPLGGYLLDKWYRRDMRSRGWFPALCLLVAGTCMTLGYALHSLPILGIGFFVSTMIPTCYHVITQEVVPARYKASSYGSLVLFLQFGGAVGATLAGTLSQSFGVQTALVVMQGAFGVSAVLFFAASFFYRRDYATAQAPNA